MTVNASANDVSIIITALESPALARLADASADDFVKTAETKDAYDALADHGGDPWFAIASHFSLSADQHADIAEQFEKTNRVSFSRAAAAVLECAPRTVETAVQIGANLSGASLARLREAPLLTEKLFRNKRELLALCRHKAQAQSRILDQIENGKAASVAEAELRLKLRKATPQAAAQFQSMRKRWKQQTPEARRSLVAWLAETGELDRILAEIRENAEETAHTDYVSAAEIAEARLSDMPHSKRGVLELAVRSAWPHIETSARGGKMRLFRIDALPQKAQDELTRRRAIADARSGAARG